MNKIYVYVLISKSTHQVKLFSDIEVAEEDKAIICLRQLKEAINNYKDTDNAKQYIRNLNILLSEFDNQYIITKQSIN
jgi:hypothetical protein